VKERIITALCLLVVVLPLVYLGGWWFMGLGLMVTGVAVWEMMIMHDQLTKVPIWMKIPVVMATLGIVFVSNLAFALLVFVIQSLLLLIVYGVLKKINVETGFFYTQVLIYIGFSFRALLVIRSQSLPLFILLIVTVILTDSGAYFTGRLFGKHKLAPKISPKKTVEGAIGGWLAGVTFVFLFGLKQQLFTEMWILIVLALGLPILSQIGDLVASALKRKYGIKDYGNIFPGHGGVMDRVDSQLLAGILLYVLLYFNGLG